LQKRSVIAWNGHWKKAWKNPFRLPTRLTLRSLYPQMATVWKNGVSPGVSPLTELAAFFTGGIVNASRLQWRMAFIFLQQK
jgi:hypothetical protein